MALMLCAAPLMARTVTIKPRSTQMPEFAAQSVLAPERSDIKKAPAKAGTENPTMALGYGTSIYSATGITGLSGPIGCGIGFTKSQMAEYAGNQVVAVNVPSPVDASTDPNYVNNMTECTVFLMESANGEHLCETKATLSSEGFEWNKVELSSPYEITGKTDIYIGVIWDELPNAANDLPFIIDGYAYDSDLSFQVYSICTGELDSNDYLVTGSECVWASFAPLFGTNLCMTMDVTGDNLPTDKASIFADYHMPTIKPNEPFYYELGVLNCASNAISAVEIKMDIEGQESQTKTVPVQNLSDGSATITFNQTGVAATEFTCTKEGYQIPYTVTITKIDGADNKLENSYSGTLTCVESGYQQMVVFEEFTSAKCAFCPMGIYGIQETKKAYPEQFIPIAVHCPVPQADNMNVCQTAGPYYPLYNAVGTANGGVSAPSGVVNRNIYDVINPSPSELADVMNSYVGAETIAKVEATVVDEGVANALTLNVDVTSALDFSGEFGIAYTLLEDNVGPYTQLNNYASGRYGACGGWENMSSSVEWIYEDVARRGTVYTPEESTYITSMTKGETKSFKLTMNTKQVKDLTQGSVVPMLVSRTDGTIVNACKVLFPGYAGLEGVAAEEKAPVAVGLIGAVDMKTVGSIYTVDGRRVAANAQGIVNLPAGIYIVATPAGNAKVVVR